MSVTERLSPGGSVAVLVLSLVALAGLAAPWLTGDPAAIDLAARLSPPSGSHWLGTDSLGRDVLARMAHGTRVSLSVGVLAMSLTTLIGVLMGTLAAHFRGWVDQIISRLIDTLLCVPSLFLVMALIVMLGPGIKNIILVIAVTGWTDTARLIRAEMLSLRDREFMLAARAAGLGPGRLMLRHLLPHALPPIFVSATFSIAGAILAETGLSLLGLGVQPPSASWGNILEGGREYLGQAWWLTLFPVMAIVATLLAINALGESLRAGLRGKDRHAPA